MRIMYFVSSRADRGICEAINGKFPGVSFPYASAMGMDYRRCFNGDRPDAVLFVGDRFETFYCAAAATLANIPIVHVHGGETTEGANDDVFRHAITKMAHLHFTANDVYRQRVIQMGEHPDTVHSVGAPGLDGLETYRTEKRSGRLMVTFHPVTRERDSAGQFMELLIALKDAPVTFTGSNVDVGGKQIDDLADNYAERHKTFEIKRSMTRQEYIRELVSADAIVGNSSSGIIEAPFLHVPTIDIGNRQKGRMAGDSVIHCAADRDAIRMAIKNLPDFNPRYTQLYGDGNASERIAKILSDWTPTVHKSFYEVKA